jgi:hypothetical protein
VSDRDRLEGVIRRREGVAAISGLPGVCLTGVATDSSCLYTQQKGKITMLGSHQNKWKETPLTGKNKGVSKSFHTGHLV